MSDDELSPALDSDAAELRATAPPQKTGGSRRPAVLGSDHYTAPTRGAETTPRGAVRTPSSHREVDLRPSVGRGTGGHRLLGAEHGDHGPGPGALQGAAIGRCSPACSPGCSERGPALGVGCTVAFTHARPPRPRRRPAREPARTRSRREVDFRPSVGRRARIDFSAQVGASYGPGAPVIGVSRDPERHRTGRNGRARGVRTTGSPGSQGRPWSRRASQRGSGLRPRTGSRRTAPGRGSPRSPRPSATLRRPRWSR